ncbi:MAG: hypothetical protein IJO53_04745 [Clostridia bacterium]|nr:hypothetical protein [Clostridia bacterium]MBQ9855483.1 hypothetical protein [Clostridia bacterium]
MKRAFFLILALILFAVPAFAKAAPLSPMLSADGSHILALDASGNVWAWGSNHRGESVPGKTDERILSPEIVFENALSITSGQQFSMAIDENSRLYAWGDNREKQIFASTDEKVLSPVMLMENAAYADACDTTAACVTKDGKCWLWGGGTDKILVSENAEKCEVGMNFAVILEKDGRVFERTLTETESKLMISNAKDISASGESRYALSEDGTLYAWGAAASDGRLAISGGIRYIETPERICQNADISSMIAGLTFSGFLTSANELYLWGTLYSYASYIDETGTVQAALVDGALLSYGSEPIRLYENVKSAAVGDAFIALLFESGDIFTWGSNDQGQLGNGKYTQTALVEAEDDEGYEAEIISSADSVFPNVPITLK